MKITRREFIKLGLISGLSLVSNNFLDFLFANENNSNSEPDLVGIQNGLPAQMFEAGIKELGGMSKFVKKGQIVLVKPNIGWAKTPEEGANTQPDLVFKIIEHSYKAGAKKVYVLDNTCNHWKDCYKLSQIEKAANEANGVIVSANDESDYKKVDAKGKILKDVLVHKLYLEADVVINVPVLKNHGSATMTSAIKNLMGVIWDRKYYHRYGLHECIAEFLNVRKPDLNVVDAYYVMFQNGPRGMSKEDLWLRKMQIISSDIVAIDAAAAKILSLEPSNINYITQAESMKFGTTNLNKINIKRITL